MLVLQSELVDSSSFAASGIMVPNVHVAAICNFVCSFHISD